jgi:hypothetical protein
MKLEVSVALKTKADEGALSVLPPKVPVACASTAAVGLGSPGNNQNACTGHDCVPRVPRVRSRLDSELC